MNQPRTRSKDILVVLGVAALALSVRLAALPFATTDGSNPAARVWIAWKWLDDPNVITHGVWGPLHFYLLALPVRLLGGTLGMLGVSVLVTGSCLVTSAWAVFRQLGRTAGVVAALALGGRCTST